MSNDGIGAARRPARATTKATMATSIPLLLAILANGRGTTVVESFSAVSRTVVRDVFLPRSSLPSSTSSSRREGPFLSPPSSSSSMSVRLNAEETKTETMLSGDSVLSGEETTENSDLNVTDADVKEDEDEEEEWVYEEFEDLTESDFRGSEWKVGTVMDKNPDKIIETWFRLLTSEDGKTNTIVWGDDSKGTWTVDVASQYFSAAKETFGGWFGKKLWAGTMDDYYFIQGTVRGWSPVSSAMVIGQWQARRLGVDKKEAGVAPWFEEKDDEEEEGEDAVDEDEQTEESAENEQE